MPVIKRIARLTEHRVTTGETLESVARDHGLTVEQLARFNWNVTDPQQINNRLRTDVGASRQSSNSRFFVFDDADDPGIILVPSGFREAGLESDRPRPHIIRVRKKQVDPNLITCFRIPGITFAYDKSFIRPSVVHFLKRLEHALEQHPDGKIMIFGHTDRSGPELYNKKLSERRAKSVYAFITDQPDIWEELYQLERWGEAILRSILADLGVDSGTDPGGSGSDMESAARAYQDTKPQLATDGIAGRKTRRAMFLDYMTGKHDIRVTDDQFLEKKFMGCGEFNPLVEPNEHELANGGRGQSPGNAENRRVVFYVFRRPPREIPCRLRDLEPCRREIARHPGQRTDRSPNPAFACEFYDRIAAHCRCEHLGTGATARIRLFDRFDTPMPFAPYRIVISGETFEDTADEHAWLTARVHSGRLPEHCLLEWGEQAEDGRYPYEAKIYLDVQNVDEEEGLQRRLHNLGFHLDPGLEEAVTRFQTKYGLEATGLAADVKEQVREEHDDSFKTRDTLFADLLPVVPDSSEALG